MIPKQIDGQNVTLDYLSRRIENPLKGHKSCFKKYPEDTHKKYGAEVVVNSYWILFRNQILPNSRGQTLTQHQESLSQLSQGFVYQLPTMLEATIALMTQHVQGNPIYLEKDSYPITKFCSAETEKNLNTTLLFVRCKPSFDVESATTGSLMVGFHKTGMVVHESNMDKTHMLGSIGVIKEQVQNL